MYAMKIGCVAEKPFFFLIITSYQQDIIANIETYTFRWRATELEFRMPNSYTKNSDLRFLGQI